jgi:hypothetical protein
VGAGRHTLTVADISILDPSAHAAPKAYKIAGAQEIVLKGVSATYDGTGAAGSFVPAVQVVDPSGFIVGTYVLGQTLAAGASADIAWFPSGGLTDTTGDLHWGINDDTSALGLTLNSPTQPLLANFGSTTFDTNGGGFQVNTSGGGTNFDTGGGGFVVELHGAGALFDVAGDVTVRLDLGGLGFRVEDPLSGNDIINVSNNGVNPVLGFFNVGPVVRQPTPVTLANVIALLQAYGLAV